MTLKLMNNTEKVANKPLQLRYGLYIHAGAPTVEQLQQHWLEFSRTEPFAFRTKEKSK